MTDLKHCPFCGAEAYLDREEIFCECGAKMIIPLYFVGQGGWPSYRTYDEAKSEMIEAWNRRANDDNN